MQQRAEMRRVPLRRRLVVALVHWRQLAGQDGMGAGEMGRVVVVQRPDDGQFISVLGDALKVLADLDLRSTRPNRSKRPADFRRSVGLGIKRVEVARPAPHE